MSQATWRTAIWRISYYKKRELKPMMYFSFLISASTIHEAIEKAEMLEKANDWDLETVIQE